MSIVIAGASAFGILLIFAALALSLRASGRVGTVVDQYTPVRTLDEIELAQPFSVRVVRPILQAIARLIGRVTPQQLLETTRLKLELAGNPFDLVVRDFLGLRGVSTILTAMLLGFGFTLLSANAGAIIFLAFIGGILGFYLPLLWLNLRIRARHDEIQSALPDALDMLTIMVEAGLAFDAAMAQVAERWKNELGRAFGREIFEVRVGKDRRSALSDMAVRAGVADLTNFVAAVLQMERMGGGIASLLRIQSEQMRVTRRQRAYAQANQTPVKLIFPLVFLFFPAMFIVILGPAIIRIIRSGF